MKLHKNSQRENISGYLFILPQLIGLLLFVVFPFCYAVYLCFAQWDFISAPTFVGMANFKAVFIEDWDIFLITIQNTLIFLAGTVPLTIIISLSLALLTNRKIRGLHFYKSTFFMPMITSSAAVAMVWYWIYAPDIGILNHVFSLFGIPGPGWLADPKWSRIAVIIMQTWIKMGYYYIVFLAGLKGIPQTHYEAAEVDGASGITKFFRITLPMLSPVTFFVTVMLVIDVFNMFSEAYVLTRGGPMYSTYSLIMYIYYEAFQSFNMGTAAVASMVLFVLAGLITAVQFILSRRMVNYDT